MDSFDIAQWADKHGQANDGKKLFPDGQLQVISKYDTPFICTLVLGMHTLYHAMQAHVSTRGDIIRCSSALASVDTAMLVTWLQVEPCL